MRIIDCIDFYILMEEGPAHRLIIVLHPLGVQTRVSQLSNNPLTGLYRDTRQWLFLYREL